MNSWIEKDLAYLWHPYTQMKDCQSRPPLLIEKAQGVKLYDANGNYYYDTIASWWCNVHGHNHPKIKKAISEQLDSLEHVLFAGFTHKPAIRLAEKLVAITPVQLTKVFFTDNGSTAVETALKMSLQYWLNSGKKRKNKFVSLDLAYHGDTVGAMSVGGNTIFNQAFSPLLFETFKVPSPYCYRCPMGLQRSSCDLECTVPLEEVLKQHKDEIAAMILEPLLMGAAGMIVYPAKYLQKAAQLAKKYDIHLIADEVATGFGRTGKMFACEHAGVSPDFMCLSKGITSGTLPLAATLTTDDIYNAFYDDYEKLKTFYHGHTYSANPVGCAAGLASLEIFEEEKTLEKIQPIIRQLHTAMEDFRQLDLVGDVRCIGMAAAVELVKDKKTKKGFEITERIGQQVFKRGLEENLILRPLGNVIYLCPALSLTSTDLDEMLKKMFKVIKLTVPPP